MTYADNNEEMVKLSEKWAKEVAEDNKASREYYQKWQEKMEEWRKYYEQQAEASRNTGAQKGK
jgi:hypothetical protein